MRPIALFASLRGITGRLPILILFSYNVQSLGLWGGELEGCHGAGRGGAWGGCEGQCFDRGEIEDKSVSALCQGKMTAAQNTDLRKDRVSD